MFFTPGRDDSGSYSISTTGKKRIYRYKEFEPIRDATPIIHRSGTSIIALTAKDIPEEQVAGKLAQLGFSYSWLGVFA